jgi:hypothetical protein
MDHATVLAMETVPASWPSPFGPLLPGVLGWAAADGWCFGELALVFAMTRPVLVAETVPFSGDVPKMVWLFLFLYSTGAAVGLWRMWGWAIYAWTGTRRGEKN